MKQKKKISTNGATTFSLIILILGLAIAYSLNEFWYGGLLAIGVALSWRQYILKLRFDAMISLMVFGFLFLIYRFNYFWEVKVSIPTLAATLAFVLLIRETLSVKSGIKSETSSPEEVKR